MPTVEILILQIGEEAKRAEEQKIISKIEQLKELEGLIEEAKAEAEALKDEIKAEMMKRNTEEMSVGKYIVRWTEVLSNRFDSTAFKKVFPSVYKEYTKPSVSRRFSISG
jgi:predicted phage-related endonuclease